MHVYGKCVVAQFYMWCAVKLKPETQKHMFLLNTDFPQVILNNSQIS